MMTYLLLIIGSLLFGYKFGWEIGLGTYICCFAICRCVAVNAFGVHMRILRNKK